MTRINHRVREDGDKIVERLHTTDVSLAALMAEYVCAYDTIMREILQRITKAEWRAIARKRLGRGGKATRFRPGHVPWDKGMKGWCPPGCEATQFKKGGMRGNAARRYRAIGTIQIRYAKPPKRCRGRANARPGKPSRYIKIRDDGRSQYRWIPYARYLWEKERGPVPKGFFVVHEDGDTMNDDPANLILVDQRENMRRLYTRQPDAIALCRKRSARAARQRHEANRQRKAMGIYRPRKTVVYACAGCWADLPAGAEQCPKCGGLTIEKIEIAA